MLNKLATTAVTSILANRLLKHDLFKQTIQFLQQINVKNVMSIQYMVLAFRTHNRLSMSRLRKPLDQGSCLVLANGFLQGNAN